MRTFRTMHAPTSPNNHRARWAAIGAAVAVSLGAGGLGIARAATNPAGASAYNPITPCRLVDTRAGSGQVGPQTGPVPADTAISIQGKLDSAPNPDVDVAGTCAGKLPANATGLQLNVTASEATQATFLTVYPTGETRPTASNVNVANANSVPNSATVLLGAGGKFDVYNRFGSVHVIIDVAGYYADHTHDVANITNESGIARAEGDGADLTEDPVVLESVAIQPPSAGYVTVSATFDWFAPAGQLNCQITDGTTTFGPGPRLRDSVATAGLAQSVSIQRTFEVTAWTGLIFSGQTFNLLCEKNTGTGGTDNVSMTATFHATEYEPFNFIFVPLQESGTEGSE